MWLSQKEVLGRYPAPECERTGKCQLAVSAAEIVKHRRMRMIQNIRSPLRIVLTNGNDVHVTGGRRANSGNVSRCSDRKLNAPTTVRNTEIKDILKISAIFLRL